MTAPTQANLPYSTPTEGYDPVGNQLGVAPRIDNVQTANGVTYGAIGVNVQHGNTISTANSSTTPLANGAAFTGTSESSLLYSAIAVNVFTDKASAANGLQIEQSQDGTNWDIIDSYTVAANTNFSVMVNLVAQNFRIIYTNGGVTQTVFRLQVIKQAAENVQPRALPAQGAFPVQLSSANKSVPTGTGNTVVKASPGVLCSIVVTTAGTAAATVYDNASTNSGTVLFATPASTSVGTIYAIYGAALNGITVANVTSGPVLTVYYN